MYQRIRLEGLDHSHVMEYASALDDGIGPRLTGSAESGQCQRVDPRSVHCDGLQQRASGRLGRVRHRLEQLNTWVRMTSPDPAVFIAQAAPWSPATNGAINAPAVWIDVKDPKDLDQYRGKLGGKIVLPGADARRPSRRKAAVGAAGRRGTEEADGVSDESAQPRGFPPGLHEATGAEEEGRRVSGERACAGGRSRPSRDGRDGGGSGGYHFSTTAAWASAGKSTNAIPPIPCRSS